MDYETKPTSRFDLRRYAKLLRELFDVEQTGPFPVLSALERIPEVFEGSGFLIVEDDKLPPQTMARCILNDDNGFTIEIKESVYVGAYEKQIGAFLGFICHEICHVFLFKIGFTPVFSRSFAEGEMPAYCSVEWQAKALCAEVMIPYEESQGMKLEKLMKTYHVSQAFAKKRRNLEKEVRLNARKNKTQ